MRNDELDTIGGGIRAVFELMGGIVLVLLAAALWIIFRGAFL